jgi:hypothetical protein
VHRGFVVVSEQLTLFDAPTPADGNGQDDPLEAVRRLVAEPGMSETEIEALVAESLSPKPTDPEPPARCRCSRRLVPPGTCVWCGRTP